MLTVKDRSAQTRAYLLASSGDGPGSSQPLINLVPMGLEPLLDMAANFLFAILPATRRRSSCPYCYSVTVHPRTPWPRAKRSTL